MGRSSTGTRNYFLIYREEVERIFAFEERELEIKGKGLMKTYLLHGLINHNPEEHQAVVEQQNDISVAPPGTVVSSNMNNYRGAAAAPAAVGAVVATRSADIGGARRVGSFSGSIESTPGEFSDSGAVPRRRSTGQKLPQQGDRHFYESGPGNKETRTDKEAIDFDLTRFLKKKDPTTTPPPTEHQHQEREEQAAGADVVVEENEEEKDQDGNILNKDGAGAAIIGDEKKVRYSRVSSEDLGASAKSLDSLAAAVVCAAGGTPSAPTPTGGAVTPPIIAPSSDI